MKINKLALAISIALPAVSMAGITSEMGDFFTNSGVANYTSPTFVRSQQAGHLTGGGAQIKTRSVNFQPARVQLPSVSAGCGGINMYTGGLSFITLNKFVEMSKSVMTVGPAFAFDLALQTFQPSIKSGMDTLRNYVEKINSFNMSSCDVAQYGVNAVADAFGNQKANEFLCKMQGTTDNEFTDWLASGAECKKKKTQDKKAKEARDDGKDISIHVPNSNLIWMLLKQYQSNIDPEAAEVIISMIGTEIYGESFQDKQTIMPIVGSSNQELLNVLLNGGKTTIWKCDSTSGTPKTCMNMKQEDIDIPFESSMKNKVRTRLQNIYDKAVANDALSDDEIKLISISNLPILRIMMINAANSTKPDIESISDILASEYLMYYLSELIDTLNYAVAAKSVNSSKEVRDILERANKAQKIIADLPKNAWKKLKDKEEYISYMRAKNLAAMQSSVGNVGV
jgi:conjugative transfer pilus assembly protein TraH